MFLERDTQLPCVAAADVEQGVAGGRGHPIDCVLELPPLRLLERVEGVGRSGAGPQELFPIHPLRVLEDRARVGAVAAVEIEIEGSLRNVVVALHAGPRTRRCLEGPMAQERAQSAKPRHVEPGMRAQIRDHVQVALEVGLACQMSLEEPHHVAGEHGSPGGLGMQRHVEGQTAPMRRVPARRPATARPVLEAHGPGKVPERLGGHRGELIADRRIATTSARRGCGRGRGAGSDIGRHAALPEPSTPCQRRELSGYPRCSRFAARRGRTCGRALCDAVHSDPIAAGR